MKLTRATSSECEAMAAVHGQAFGAKSWREDEFEDADLEGERIYGFLAATTLNRSASSFVVSRLMRWKS